MRYISVRVRLMFLIGTILVLGSVLNNLTNYMASRTSLRASIAGEVLPLISDSIYSEVQWSLMRPIYNSSLMAKDSFLKDWVLDGEKDESKIVKYLSEIKNEYDYFTSFFVSDRTGKYYYYDGVLKSISPEDDHDVWFYKFKDLSAEYDLDVDTDEATTGTMTLFINHRMLDYNGRFLGVTGVGLKMQEMGRILQEYREAYRRQIFMIDSEGLIQIHSNQKLVETTNIADLDGISQVGDALLANKEETAIYEFERGGQHLFVSARYFPDLDWFLLVEHDETTALKPVRRAIINSALVDLFITSLVLLTVFWVVNWYQKRLEFFATTDELTGLHNRRHFMHMARREALVTERYHHKTSILLIDVDHFKRVNDSHGHQAGDRALASLANTIKKSLREVDLLGRLGGEEFVALLPETGRDAADQVANRMREAVETAEIEISTATPLKLTVSVGIATSMGEKVNVKDLIKRADQAMYRAKKEGRNRVRHSE